MYRFCFLFISVLFLMVIPLVWAQQGRSTGQRLSQSVSGPPVAVAQVSEQFHTISVGGRLQPKSRIVHRTFNAGIIRSVAVEEGNFVEEGQELFSSGRKDDVKKEYEPFVVTARISGWVSEVLIQTDDETEDAEPAVIIIGTEGYVLEAYISDKDASKVTLGQQVTARTAGGDVMRGVLANRSQEPDYNTGLFTLTFHFTDRQKGHIGEFVTIDLPVDRATGVFVPREIVIRRYGKYFLWVVNGAQELEAREVVLGPVYGEFVRIEKGLQRGDRYLTRLTGREKEGMKINAPGS
jgi:multidrug efflux pump subunit AcrA (membrane-fusion protein)